jgi:hypothetical protein
MIKEAVTIPPKTGIRIKQTGIFDLSKLLKKMYAWFDSRKYDIHQKDQTEKSTDKGLEIVMKWLCEREITDYFKYEILVEFLMKKLQKTSKKDVYNGSAQVTFKAKIILDQQDRWKYKPLGRLLFFINNNYLVKDQINKHKEKLYKEVIAIHDLTKSVLDLYK